MPGVSALCPHGTVELLLSPVLCPQLSLGRESQAGSGRDLILLAERRAGLHPDLLALAFPTPALFSAVKTRTKDKYRVVYTDHQRLELEKEFHYSRYITIRRKAELASSLGLSERQVCPTNGGSHEWRVPRLPRVTGMSGGRMFGSRDTLGWDIRGGGWGWGLRGGRDARDWDERGWFARAGDALPVSPTLEGDVPREPPPSHPFPLPLAGENLVPEQAGEGEEDQQEEAAAGAAWRRGAPQPRRPAAGSRGGGGCGRAGSRRSSVTAAGGPRHRDCWRSRPRRGRAGPGRVGAGGARWERPRPAYALHRPTGPAVCTDVQCMCLVVRGKCGRRFINIIIIMFGWVFLPWSLLDERVALLVSQPLVNLRDWSKRP